MSDRDEYVKGLRMLADLLEQHDDLPLPTHGDVKWLLFGTPGEKDIAAQVVRLVPGTWQKVVYGDEGDKTLYSFQTTLRGLPLGVTVYRNAVCERVVIGTEEITKQVPDPSVKVPLVEVTEEVEKVEWRCAPLLAPDQGPAGQPAVHPGKDGHDSASVLGTAAVDEPHLPAGPDLGDDPDGDLDEQAWLVAARQANRQSTQGGA